MSFRSQLIAAVTANMPYKRRLSYLRSTGTQYIRTGILLQPWHYCVVDISHYTAGSRLFGSQNTSTAYHGWNVITARSGDYYCNYNQAWASSGAYDPSDRHKIGVGLLNGQYVLTVDGEINATYSAPTEGTWGSASATSYGAILFGVNSGSSAIGLASMYCHGCTIYDGRTGAKVQDLIPVLDNNLVACMYDKVSKTFFYNAGTGAFDIPPQNDIIIYTANSKLTLYSESNVLAHGFSGGTGWVLTEQSPLTTFSNWFRGTAVKTIAMPDTVTTLVEYCCYNCTSLTTINIPSWITAIPDYAFSSDYSLANVTLPDGLLSTGRDSFYNSGIRITELPSGMRSIGQRSFGTCSNVVITDLPATLTSIAQSAFGNCSGITEMNIPASVTTIPNGAFSACSSLATVTINGSGQSIGMAFNACSSLATVTFTGKPASIYQAFSSCDSLTDIYVPWSDGELSGAPWGATNATVHYNS